MREYLYIARNEEGECLVRQGSYYTMVGLKPTFYIRPSTVKSVKSRRPVTRHPQTSDHGTVLFKGESALFLPLEDVLKGKTIESAILGDSTMGVIKGLNA